MITKFGKSNPPISQNSIYNTGILDLSIARNNFVNAVTQDSGFPSTINNFNTFIDLIYINDLQNNLNFWISGEYTSRSGTIVDFKQDIDKIYFYSKNKDYSGQYLQYKNYKAKCNNFSYISIDFIDNTSLYYNLEADKVFPLNGQDKTYIIVMSSIDDGNDFLDYTFSDNENDWLFHYGLDFSNSLQPTCEGLCFTYDESDSSNGKLLSLNTGGNNNLITSSNTGNTNIKGRGVFFIKIDNTSSRQISLKYNNSVIPSGINYSLYMDNASDIKSGNGFFLNSHVINNSISNTSVSYNNMRNWRLFEFMVFDKILDNTETTNIYNYLNSKYGLVI